MTEKPAMILIVAFSFIMSASGMARAQDIAGLAPFKKSDRLLILAPHPDDEAIACGGVIQQAKKSGAEIKIVYLTNGDHNQFAFIVYEKRLTFRKGEFLHMGQVRSKEAIKAMKLLGLSPSNLVFLGYPDFGTFSIFSKYWQKGAPFKSMLTRVSSVPYKNDFSFGASYIGESILNDLEKIILGYKPTMVFVSHPADANLDHKALYLFLQIALRDLKDKMSAPQVYPYLIHASGWPKPRRYHPELNLDPPKNFTGSQINWLKLPLSPQELERKRRAILCYRSQTQTSAFYLLSFARRNELFGDYPEIELKKQVSLREHAPAFFGFSKMFASLGEEENALANEGLKGDHGQVSYAVADHSLLIRVAKDKELIRRFKLILYLFGSSAGKPFASMPKIRIVTKYDKFRAYDGKKRINSADIRLKLDSEGLILRVPLAVLGDPDFILVSVRAYGKKFTPAATGFRRIAIK